MSRPIKVNFKGGPLGGEERILDRSQLTGRIYRVPARVWTGVDYEHHALSDMFDYSVEEYELRPTSAPSEYEGLWKHPQQSLIRENERLKREIAQLEDARVALEAFRKLKGLL